MRTSAFSFSGEVRPEEGDEVGHVSPAQRGGKAGLIIDVRSHHLGAQGRKGLSGFGMHIPGDGPNRESLLRIRQDRLDQSATLGSGRTNYCDYFPTCHMTPHG